ncbi:Zona pellucida sperm-binding protein 4 [Anabarilius grahami]|uniref:Zona pellucida sperm-binding protein 4 n=1 Tax=Anabarilius grahami TaxID=495550 RepID=A0A3N0YJX4_ANAGA|nr:Zona pellucida sperm-binding protein 4 [Anabarilius grahami]
MSCELKTLTTVFILSTIGLYLNCRSLCATSERKGYSGGSSSSMLLYNFVDESGAFESNVSSPNLKRIRRARSKNKNETIPLQSSKNMYELRSNDSASMHLNNEKTPLRSFHKRAFGIEAGFQGDAPAFGGPGISRKMYQSVSSSQSTDMWLALPMVHCSEEVMTLTASGSEYMHIFVVRANAAPLPLSQVPTYCGYSVRVTWKDLVLMAPYDGCYITKENGSYVLSLQWWGSPINISCPMTPVISQPTPSILCSQFGMVIAIEGAQEAAERHGVKVNGNVLPLLSETCAYRIYSPEVVLLHTAFSSECVTVTDGENILVVILDGKQFTLSCPFPYHLSRFLPYLHPHPFHERQQPVTPTPDSAKPVVIPHLPYEQPAVPQFQPDKHPHTSHHYAHPIHQIPNVHQHQKPPTQMYHYPAPPVDAPPQPSIQQHLPLPVDQIPQTHEQMVPQYPVMPPPHYAPKPISCPPYPESFCSQYPIVYHHPPYHQPAMTTASQPTIQPMPWTSFPRPTYKPLVQEALFPQIPVFPPTSPEEPPKMSPSLVCMQNRVMATLPSARMDSIKVKDVNTNTWMSIASVPAACNYILHSRGGSVELSSPLPSCHSQRKSPTVISLYVRFWDTSQLRLRTLQLQCHYVGDGGTQPTVPPFKPLHQIEPDFTTIHTPAQPPPKFQVLCSSQHMSVKLPPVPTSGLIVEAASSGIRTEAAPILKAPSHCGYSVRRGKDGAINVVLPYSSCHMTQKDGQYRIILKYQTPEGRTVESFLSCQASFSQECNVAHEQQLVCGSGALSSSECHDRGCCYCVETQSCYYPMDECTMDRHFVFSVHSSVADPPFSPATLVTAGNSPCTPDKVTADLALFKIPLDECGVHRYEVGKTVIYMVEILNRVQPISLNYGTITRDSPARLLVECRYLPGSVVSVGYLVKSPSLGPSIKAQGVFGVQLRIAKDEHYDSFYPQYHQPLHVLLGKPLYLEVRLLNPPDPTAMLLVHYCVAYPRSAKSAWILIYDGCPNFLDQTPTHKPPPTPAEALTNHVRRFTITTFQFLSEDANLLADEEVKSSSRSI